VLAHWATRFALLLSLLACGALRALLAAELLRSGRRDDELLFGGASGSPFWLERRAAEAEEHGESIEERVERSDEYHVEVYALCRQRPPRRLRSTDRLSMRRGAVRPTTKQSPARALGPPNQWVAPAPQLSPC
jgi:hypothetical protein